ncbi:hypothetical protein [Rhodopirellula sp. SWK7]|uniref:hypothetical protein n=1 Tax=Rhodopirellula sp. SWK7 TaxID=595460 RepID=UPI0002BF5DBA|nr:hypothetical protein [Rhodopirellula sp. SWK7]EMI44194.1 putative secreted protein [Rhodopirellula sp. SWK7]
MNRSFILLPLLLCMPISAISVQADDELERSHKGELLFEELFIEMTPRLSTGVGDWQIVDRKFIKGKELAKNKHTAFRKFFLNHQDVIYQFDVRFEGDSYAKLLINYDLVHLANCVIKPTEISITKLGESKKRQLMSAAARKNGLPIEEGPWQKKNILLDSQKMNLTIGQWHTVTVELVGDQLTARVGDVVARGKHPGLTEKKTNFGIQAAGLDDYVHFDNLRVWTAVTQPTN